MITGKLKADINKLWEEIWTGGITNPLTIIEQISFLMFARLLDVDETRREKQALRTKKPYKRLFSDAQQELRWSRFRHVTPAQSMLELVRDKVFEHFRTLNGGTTFAEYMSDAQLVIQKANLLVSVVNQIEKLPITDGDAKGDLYEYLLGKLTTAGINGQFRTPRHIIALMVAMLKPEPTETVCDPACGTAGFLVGVMEYLRRTHTSKAGLLKGDEGQPIYTGDQLEPYRDHIQNRMFHGFDFDTTMLRIASMNLMLHGVDNPDIHYQDTLSTSFPERFPKLANGAFDVVLANPPFKGSLDAEDVHASLTQKVKTKKTELLFLVLILRMLKKGGRSATIVPDGVLFNASKAHVALRQLLVDKHQLEAVISLPSGVFKPYAGVSTAIVVFRKEGKTDHVFFYDVAADGFSLDDKRLEVKENDLPDALARWNARDAEKDTDRTAKHFMVPADEIREKGFDLSINRYKQAVHEVVKHESPRAILKRLRAIEGEIAEELTAIEGML